MELHRWLRTVLRGKSLSRPISRQANGSDVAFIIACPRSGTTWLRQALNAHHEIHCTEKRLFGMYGDIVLDAGVSTPRFRLTLDRYVDSQVQVLHTSEIPIPPDELRHRLLADFSGAIDASLRELTHKKLIVDKITPYEGTAAVVAKGIQEHFPGAKIVNLVRDGRDVATSGVFHWLNKREANEGMNPIRERRRAFFVDNSGPSALDRFFSDEDLANWCRLWTTALTVRDILGDEHPVLDIRYESMIEDFPAVLVKIFSFLGVDSSAESIRTCVGESSFERMSGGRSRGQEKVTAHVRKGVVGDWRQYFTRRDGEIFYQLAGAELLRLGYVDSNWIDLIPESLTIIRE